MALAGAIFCGFCSTVGRSKASADRVYV